jgi:hypothetical protein
MLYFRGKNNGYDGTINHVCIARIHTQMQLQDTWEGKELWRLTRPNPIKNTG